ncbi:MAG: hypothetical protein ACOCV1_06515 [Bacillota bacterium]
MNEKNKKDEKINEKIEKLNKIENVYPSLIDEIAKKIDKKELKNKDDIDKYINNIKTSLHYEKQKFQIEKDKNKTVDDHIKQVNNNEQKNRLIKKKQEYKIKIVGIDISNSENKAMHSIMTLLSNTDYKGNRKGVELKGQIFNYNGFLPEIEFYPNEYLDIFGVSKFKTKRNKEEYSQEGRRQALQALISLTQKQFFFYYIKSYTIKNNKGKEERRHDVIREISPLIAIMEGWKLLTDNEMHELTKNNENKETDKKRTKIVVRPSPILIEQIDTYFVMKPKKYLEEIKQKIGKKVSKYTYKFIDLLFVEVAQSLMKQQKKFDWIFERNWKTLASNLKMDNYIKKREWSRIRKIIIKSYDIAKELGYIHSYELDIDGQTKELDRIHLNHKRFYKPKEIENELKNLK